MCDLNSLVRARVSCSRTSFFTPPNLKSEASTPKTCVLNASVAIIRSLVVYVRCWYTFQGKVYLLGGCTCKHILGVDTSDLRFGGVQRCGHLQHKVRRCIKTHPRAGNSCSYWAVQDPQNIKDWTCLMLCQIGHKAFCASCASKNHQFHTLSCITGFVQLSWLSRKKAELRKKLIVAGDGSTS